MQYIFNFRYKPETELNILNEFIKNKKLKWKKRIIQLNGDIQSQFVLNGEIDLTLYNENTDFIKIKKSGVYIDSIEKDNGKCISVVF